MARWDPSRDRPFQLQEWLLILVFLTLPLEGIGLLNRGNLTVAGGVTIAKLFILASLGTWVLRSILAGDRYLFHSVFGFPTSIIILTSIAIAFASIMTEPVHNYFGQIFVQAVSLYLLYLMIVGIIQARDRVFKWCLAALLIGSFSNSMGGMYEMVTGRQIMKGRIQTNIGPANLTAQQNLYTSESGRYRIASFSGDTGIHGVHWAVYGAMSLAVPFYFRKTWARIAGWGFVMITVINCLGTGTRTGMAALTLGGGVFFLLARIRNKAQIAMGGAIAAVLLSFAMGAPLERILGKGDAASMSVDWRFAMTKIAASMIHEHPILGVGLGNYLGLYYKHMRWADEASKVPTIMHNGYLAVWAEQGTLGLIAFLSMFGSAMLVLLRLIRRPANDYIHYTSVGLLGGLVAHLFTQVGYPLLGDEQGYFLMGFAISLYAVNEAEFGRFPYAPAPSRLPAPSETAGA